MKLTEWFSNLLRPRNASYGAPSSWLVDLLTGGRSAAGNNVSSTTALGLISYFACIRVISEDIGKVPVKVYRRKSDSERELQRNHPVYSLLHDSPNPEMTAMAFFETLTAHALGWCGGYAEIVRRDDGRPAALYPLDPACVQIYRQDKGQGPFGTAPLEYHVKMDTDRYVVLQDEDVLHLHGLGYDGITGWCMAHMAKDAIGAALATQVNRGNFYKNGTNPSLIVTLPNPMKPENLAEWRKQFEQRHTGAQNSHRPIVLDNGATIERSSTSPKDAEMLGTLKYDGNQMAQLFRVPPHKIGIMDNATFSNIEHQAIEYVTDTLLSWSTRWQQEIQRKLFLPGERSNGMFAEFDFRMLMQGDSAARSEFYNSAVNNGWMTINEVRQAENLPSIGADGDKPLVQGAMTSLEKAIADDPEPAPPEMPVTLPLEDDEMAESIAEAHTMMFEHALAKRLAFEANKVSKARNGDTFSADIDKLFGGEDEIRVMRDVLGPIVDALAIAICKLTAYRNDAAAMLELTKELASHHQNRTMTEYKDKAAVSEWQTTRASDDARHATAAVVAKLREINHA